MDLRTFPGADQFEKNQVLSLSWYQPYRFSDTIASGIAGPWLMKGMEKTVLSREENPRRFDRFWGFNSRLAQMYQDWIHELCALSPVELGKASVLDVACNTGYFLYELKRRGAGRCLGIDPADFRAQRAILSDITRIRNIDFHQAKYSSDTHRLESLGGGDSFDLVVAVFIAQHLSDPLHFIREISGRTRQALLLETLTFPDFPYGMAVRYIPHLPHHQKWGNEFPNHFDTWVSRGLLLHSLRSCGFKKIIQLKYRPSWLPFKWYFWHTPVICLR